MSDLKLAYLLRKFGKLAKSRPFSAERASLYEGKLPDALIELWRAEGIGMWLKGKFQFCDPQEYTSITKMICSNDLEFSSAKSHIFGFTAFGELLLWNEQHGNFRVNLPNQTAQADKLTSNEVSPDIDIKAALMFLDDDSTDVFEDTPDAKPMFQKTLVKLGELDLGECYGFFPALALGGEAKLPNVRRVRALEHFAFLAQLGSIKLYDYGGGTARFVREIG